EAHPAGRWLALARTYWCALLVLTDAEQEALAILDGVLALAERVAASEAVALAHSYRGLARARLGDPSGVADLREGLALSGPPMHHEFTVRAHCNAVDGLRHLGRDAEE